ncbi:hypothetical protein SAMN05892883_4335 [Jatrophihabitans sp. GAS493]|nr:hypothetical protein SAMN05892883_4335 [Jatrophihabitans sp. GAS493]
MAIGAIVALLSGCATMVSGTPTKGIGAFPSSAASTESTPSQADPTDSSPTSEESPAARAMMLTTDELPAGWRDDTSGDDGDDPGDDDSSEPACMDDILIGYLADESAEGDWVKGDEDTGPWLTESIGLADSSADAADAMATAAEDFDACPKIAFGTGADRFTGSITPVSLSQHLDESHGYRLQFKSGGTPFSFYFEVIRKGSTLMAMLAGGIHPVTQPAFEQIVARGYQKLK